MSSSDAIPDVLLKQGPRRRRGRAGPAPGALSQLPAAGGPLADRPGAARPARCLRPGPGDLPESPPRVRPVPGLDRARADRLAAADPGPHAGQPGQAPPPPGPRLPAAGVAGGDARPLEPGHAAAPWPTRSSRPATTRSGASRPCCWPTRWRNCLPTIARCSSCVTWSTSPSTRSPRGWADRPARCAMLWKRAMDRAEPVVARPIMSRDELSISDGVDAVGLGRCRGGAGARRRTWPTSRPAGRPTPSGCWPSTRRSPASCGPAWR